MTDFPMDPLDIRPPAPPPQGSAFLWAGLTCLLAAGVLGVGLTALSAVNPERRGWLIALALLSCGFLLLLAHSRYPVWRRTAGMLEPLPSEAAAITAPERARSAARTLDVVLCLILAVVAVVPRLLAMRHSLWYDELWTLKFMRAGPLYAVTHQESFNNHLLNSLLGSFCVEAYRSLFGNSLGSGLPPAWVMRLPAFAFGIGSVVMLYAALRRQVERPVAAIAALLLALSPVGVDLSAQARGYTALMFFTIAQAYFLGRALRTSAASAWIGWIVCAVLGTFAHLYFVMVVAVDVVFLIGAAIWSATAAIHRGRARAIIEQAGLMLPAWAALSAICYAGVWYAIRSTNARFAGTEPMARARDIVVPLLQLWGGVPQGDRLTVYYVAAGLLALLGLWYLSQRAPETALYLPLLLLLPPMIAEAAQPHFLYLRFFAFALPAFLALIACGLQQVARLAFEAKPERRRGRWGTACLATAAFLGLTLPGLREVLALPKQDVQGAATFLQREAEQGNTIIALGQGKEYLRDYGLTLQTPETAKELDAGARGKPAVIVDTNLMVNPKLPPPPLCGIARAQAGTPIRVFRGRWAGWPSRWLDGDSDILIYRRPGGR